jgi:primosomal protein N'
VKANNFEKLQMALKNIENEGKKSKKVQIIIDVDPYMLL